MHVRSFCIYSRPCWLSNSNWCNHRSMSILTMKSNSIKFIGSSALDRHQKCTTFFFDNEMNYLLGICSTRWLFFTVDYKIISWVAWLSMPCSLQPNLTWNNQLNVIKKLDFKGSHMKYSHSPCTFIRLLMNRINVACEHFDPIYSD